MEEVTKKVVISKINHKNAIKSCQIVLFTPKTAAEWVSSSTVDLPSIPRQKNRQKMPIFATQCFLLPLQNP